MEHEGKVLICNEIKIKKTITKYIVFLFFK